jgi:hypothetical protein
MVDDASTEKKIARETRNGHDAMWNRELSAILHNRVERFPYDRSIYKQSKCFEALLTNTLGNLYPEQ